MALSPRLEFRQGQSLVITPQLQQAIKLLQLSNLELDAFVEAELERNPLLARDEPEIDDPPERDAAPERDEGERLAESAPGGEIAGDLDARHDDVHVDASPGDHACGDAGPTADANAAIDWSKANKGGAFDHDGEDMAAGLSAAPTLHEHLDAQITLLGLAPVDAAIAAVLLDAVDEGGYLRADPADVAARLGCSLERADAVLARLQGLDPVGVFARDVRECLGLQLRRARPARSGHADPAGQPAAAGQARHGGLEAGSAAWTTTICAR